ncbi:MAG: glucose-6-phosphate dehydrogenase [Beijerinckiaceae bacterium]
MVFGATGDLTHRLLLPALYNLSRWNLLPEKLAILGIGRTEQTADALREDFTKTIQSFVADRSGEASADVFDEKAWAKLAQATDYLAGDISDPALSEELRNRVAKFSSDGVGCNVLFYLAVAAKFFGPVVQNLAKAGVTKEAPGCWRRVIIEKPFGHDYASAVALNQDILKVLSESQIFRIDHFLGKETVQNIMALRFGNGFFEPIWNRDHIDHVQITVAETVGVETRGSFYDATGAMRDMVPNHLFQLFTMTAMEPPISFDADAVRDRKEDVLRAMHRMSPQDASQSSVRAQYTSGEIKGKSVRDYRAEADVDPQSQTETYVAMRLSLDNWRWAGVPFYLRTGKSMTKRKTEIAIKFKQAPLSIFRNTSVDEPIDNWLILHIQPDEGVSWQFGAKVPGPTVQLEPVNMKFSYKDFFKVQPSTGYETLLYDAMSGDATLFQRADNIEAGWRVVQPILDLWKNGEPPMATYPAGSAGPKAADELLAKDGRHWRPL